MTKCYTFYSYKGGSGRSTTAANTVPHPVKDLKASPANPILIVDADLESAGLTYLLGCENKFSGVFGFDSVHTSLMLKDFDDYRKSRIANRIFQSEKQDTYSVIEGRFNIINELHYVYGEKKKLGRYSSVADVEKIIGNVKLRQVELDCLERIVDVVFKKFKGNTLEEKEMVIFDTYQKKLIDLLNSLYGIEHDSRLRESEKLAEKQRIMRGFLPADSFVDVSEQFGCEAGTVKFLGVDLKYKDNQPKENELKRIVFGFILLCNHYNYAAVVFDSGSGTQSTAHALNQVSSAIVYCMRPTLQFIKGTRMQLINYRESLSDCQKVRIGVGDKKPIVILLPTAVPQVRSNQRYVDDSFKKIKDIVDFFNVIIDPYFCTPETALNEVEAFKWNERILLEKSGVEDEDRAFGVYQNIAKHLVDMSTADGEV